MKKFLLFLLLATPYIYPDPLPSDHADDEDIVYLSDEEIEVFVNFAERDLKFYGNMAIEKSLWLGCGAGNTI